MKLIKRLITVIISIIAFPLLIFAGIWTVFIELILFLTIRWIIIGNWDCDYIDKGGTFVYLGTKYLDICKILTNED